MKPAACIYVMALLVSGSCATLDVGEIRNLEKVAFDPVTLQPAWEANNLRIDLIRQTEGDSTGSEDVPYHPMGFDLGNGLFYDLNKNLSFRLGYLSGFSPDEDFEIYRINKPARNGKVTVYRFHHDSLTTGNARRKKARYIYHLEENGDSISYMRKGRMKYAIVDTDTSLIYSGKRRKRDAIYKLDANQFYLNKRKKRNHFQLSGNDLLLGKEYVVSSTNDNLRLEIRKQRKRRGRALYVVERDMNNVFFYKKDFSGMKFERRGNSLAVYRNSVLLANYELKRQSR
jgi:hypothetical protein